MMSSFFLYFLICNLYISGIILLLLTIKAVLRRHLSGKFQYRIWFPLFLHYSFLLYRFAEWDSCNSSPDFGPEIFLILPNPDMSVNCLMFLLSEQKPFRISVYL